MDPEKVMVMTNQELKFLEILDREARFYETIVFFTRNSGSTGWFTDPEFERIAADILDVSSVDHKRHFNVDQVKGQFKSIIHVDIIESNDYD